MARSSNIQHLLDKVEELYSTQRNQTNLDKWVLQPNYCRDKWRGLPAPIDECGGLPPIVVNTELSLQSSFLGFSLKQYFHDPAVYLESYLRNVIFRFEQIQDDVPVLLNIPIWLGDFEATLFGCEMIYSDDRNPWIQNGPVFHDFEEVKLLALPDFASNGIVATGKQFYETICEYVSGRGYSVTFLEWLAGPFGVTMHLLGMENVLTMMILDPESSCLLMDFMTISRIEWTKQRAQFLDEIDQQKAAIFNDEVNCPLISPQHYQELIQPYELRIVEYHNGLNYWHSCGNCTLLLDLISLFPLDLLHVSPWTDLQKAASIFGPKGTALEICVNPVDDVLSSNETRIVRTVRQIKEKTFEAGVSTFFIEAGPLNPLNSPNEDLEAIHKWVDITRRTLSDFYV